ncbi:MAG: cytochrome C oxidase subunit IV family protein [Candidatus Omnitrophica bacterium]|nr:cytochrome C oxidase subunit IV family protein [Candidatus Omnitrophota bacterium]
MDHGSKEHIERQVKVYISVFAALAFLTVVTVAVSYLKLPFAAGVAVALFIALIKGSLVAAFFMHLLTEKQIIFSILAVTALFFAFLLLLPAITSAEVMSYVS